MSAFLGALVDGIAVGIAAFAIAYFTFNNLFEPYELANTGIVMLSIIYFIIGIAVYLLVNGYLMYKRSQTIGKYLLGMQVVDLKGEPISGNTYLLKRLIPISLMQNIPVIGGLIALLNALLIFREEHNCLHDDIAGTRVVSTKASYDDMQTINTELSKTESEAQLEPSEDFVDYSYADLISALNAIDEEQYPDRVKKLKLEINYRKSVNNFN